MREASNGWEQKKLSELLQLLGGNAFKSSDSTNVGIRWLKIANVGFGKVEWDAVDYLPNSFRDEYLKYVLSENDVVMALTRPILNGRLKIAKVGKEDTPALLNQRVAKLIPNNGFSLEYLYQLLTKRSTVAMIENAIAGTDPPNLGFNDMKKISLTVPVNVKEQQKIASILSTWDKAIELKEKLIEQKKEQKKGLMQKLLTGEVRLPGFNGEWVDSSLEKVIDFYNGYAFKSADYQEEGKYKVITIANVQDGKLDLSKTNKIDSLSHDIREYQILKLGDIVLSMTGNVGRVCIIDAEHCLLNQRVGKVSPTKIDKYFLYFILRSERFLNEMTNMAQGGAQGNLSVNDIKSFKIQLPNELEQKKIGKVLYQFESSLILMGKELEMLKQQKQGLMQNLLTGKIRVKV